MKIILATDPLFWPLTGIGKYTLELAKRLSREPRITDIRFFNLGHWQDAASVRGFGNERGGELSNKNPFQQAIESLRKALAKNKHAVKAYSHITPYLYQRRLKPFASEYIYHGPNFILPRFDGRTVATFHDLSVLKFPEFHPEARVSFVRPEILKAAERADHIITVSEAVRQEVIDYFSMSPDDVTAVPEASCLGNDVPDATMLKSFLESHGLLGKQYFLFVSSIEPRKNIGRILDAYESRSSAFKQQYPLVLTGSSGWKSEAILDRIHSLSQSGTVHYLGYTSDEQLKYLYHSAGALVFPSIYEGFGLPIVEAQSMGVPVITSNLSCMPEVAGQAALLVDPYDVDDLSHALERIMLDQELRLELKAKGLENAAKFSWDRTISMTLEVYSRL